MRPDLSRAMEQGTPPETERPDDGRSRALVPVERRRVWRDPGPRMIAAVCYFAWVGWITAPLPLVLLSSRRMRAARGVPYHLFASAGWSVLVAAVRLMLYAIATWLGTCEGPRYEAVCYALGLIHLVVVMAFALLMSSWYAVEALMGREISLPPLSDWARRRANHFLGLD